MTASASSPPLAAADFDRLAAYYDLEHEDIADDLPLYTEFARAAPGPVLELACGTGRVLSALRQAEQPVVGLDLSKVMLAHARRRMGQDRAPIWLLRGDMRAFRFRRQFGLIVVAFNSLMHLETQQEQQQALAGIARQLHPDGRAIVDLFNPDTTLDESKEGQLFLHCLHYLPQRDAQLLHFHSVRTDRAMQVVSVHSYYDETAADGSVRRLVAPYRLRYLTRFEVELLWRQAGLQIEAIYGDYELGPFQEDSQRLLVVARRQPPSDA